MQNASGQDDDSEGVQGSPLPAPKLELTHLPPPLQLTTHNKTVSVFREHQLLSAANANNAENSGVRCAYANNRGANTNANYGFPLYMPFRGYGSTRAKATKI
jgi:hypothetical protein